MKLRPYWVIVHRWAGLTIALFLVVAGLTGTLLAFHDELELWSAPQLHRAPPPYLGAPMLDPQRLRDHVLAEHPGGTVDYLPLRFTPERSVILSLERVDPASRARTPWSQDWDELFVNPYTGRTIGHRRWGDIKAGAVNILPFLYRLHYSFALGSYGLLAFGIVALIWTIDCFIGLYLTFPLAMRARVPTKGRAMSDWWSRWRLAWLVRWGGGSHRLTFDLHRAGALWIWPLLLVFAWSGVFFNLTQVYRPVMGWLGYEGLEQGVVPPPEPRYRPRLDFHTAEAVGKALARTEAARLGLFDDPSRESGLLHRPDAGVYAYIFSSSADMRVTGGRSLIIFDSNDGRLVKTIFPQGQNAANSFTEWISALHMADVWGLPWRIAVSATGLLVAILSVTGIMIWLRKRLARRLARQRKGIARRGLR